MGNGWLNHPKSLKRQKWSNLWKTSAQWGFNWERCLDCQQKLADESTNNSTSWPAKWGTSTTQKNPKMRMSTNRGAQRSKLGEQLMPLAVCIDPTKMSTNRNGDTSHQLHPSVSKTEREAWNLWVSLVLKAYNSSLEALKTSGHVGHVVKTNGLVTLSLKDLKVGVSPIPMDFSWFHHVPFLFHSHVGLQKPNQKPGLDRSPLSSESSSRPRVGDGFFLVIRVSAIPGLVNVYYGKSPCSIAKSTVKPGQIFNAKSTVKPGQMFNSKLLSYQRVTNS